MSNKSSAIIFDLDGTLVDSARDLSASLNYVLKQAGRTEIPLSRVRHMVGNGAKAMIIKGFSETGTLPDSPELAAILKAFLDYYAENITRRTIIFPGALDVIKKLADRGIPLGLCTNKALKLTEKLVTEIGLSGYFTTIVGGDSFDYQKPDPRHIISTVENMKCPMGRAIMVGDSANDVIAAKAAGIPVICVSFGYSQTPIAELDPDYILDHYDDFFNALAKVSKYFQDF